MASRDTSRCLLEYPVTKPYPWPQFTSIAACVSVVVIIIITLVNVVAVGYENTTLVLQNFNYTPTYWWSSFTLFKAQESFCQPHTFAPGDTFITNNSVFQYTLLSVPGVIQENPFPNMTYELSNSLSYSGNLLSSMCNPTQMSPAALALIDQFNANNLTITMSIDGTGKVTATIPFIYCTMGTQVVSIGLTYVSGTSIDVGDMTVSGGSIFLDELSMDIAVSYLAWSASNVGVPIAGVLFLAFAEVGIQETSPWTTESPDGMMIHYNTRRPEVVVYETQVMSSNGSDTAQLSGGGLLQIAAFNISVQNYLNGMVAQLFADLGAWDIPNILASPELLNMTIDPNDPVTSEISTSPLSQGYPQIGTSAAAAIRADPDEFVLNSTWQTPAVISQSYFCQIPQLKKPLNFVISVLVADMSMFATFWGIMTACATYLAKRRKRTDPEERLHATDQEGRLHVVDEEEVDDEDDTSTLVKPSYG